ncbi:MAG TPA: hypothetical protein VMZ91_13435 [Candidatus Paceibacterota bacterium]|nr:hypothetical protein [Candidatus Paceibacterota bacterium]
MKTYKVTIEGISPLLMNRPSSLIGDISKEKTQTEETPRVMAEKKLYITDKGKLYQPETHIKGSLVEAGKDQKVVGKGKSTYSKIIGYAVEINPFEIEHKKQKWDVYSVLAVNPSTRGRNLLHRPMLKEWELDFEITFDDDQVPASILKECLERAGKFVGLGDWRPAKKGRFGKFQVTSFKEAK